MTTSGSDRTIQIGVEVDSTQAAQGLTKISQAAQRTAADVSQAGKLAGDGIAKIGDGAPTAEQKITRSAQSIINSIERTTAALKSGGAQSAEYYQTLAKQRGIDPATLDPYIQKLKQAEAAQLAASQSLKGMGMSAQATAAAMRTVPAQFTDIVTSLQGGQSPLTVLFQQGGQLKDQFGGVGAAARALGGYVLGLVNPITLVAAGVAALSVASYQGAKEQQELQKALILTGNQSGVTSGKLAGIAQDISKVGNVTRGAAVDALLEFVNVGIQGASELKRFSAAAVEFERVGGKSVGEVAKNFKSLAESPLQSALKLNESVNFLTESTYKQIRALESAGKTQEAAKVAQAAYAKSIEDQTPDLLKNLGLIEKAWLAIKGATGGAWDAAKNIGRMPTLQDQIKTLEAQRSEKLQQSTGAGFGSNAGGAAFGVPMSNARQSQARDQADALGEQIKLLKQAAGQQELIAAQKAQQLENTKNLAEWDKKGIEFLTDKQRMNKEISAEQVKGAELVKNGLITQEDLNKRIAAIRNKYAGIQGESEVASIKATNEQRKLELDLLRQYGVGIDTLTDSEKKAIQIRAQLKTEMTGQARQQKLLALAEAERGIEIDKQIVAEKNRQRLDKQIADDQAKMVDQAYAGADAIRKQTEQIEASNAVYGKGKVATAEFTLAQQKEKLARLELLGLTGDYTSALKEQIVEQERYVAALKAAEYKDVAAKSDEVLRAAREQQKLYQDELQLVGLTSFEREKIVSQRAIELKYAKLIDELNKSALSDAEKQSELLKLNEAKRIEVATSNSKAIQGEYTRLSTEIEKNITDALMRGFESGKGFAQNLKDVLVNMFKTLVLRPIVSAIVSPISQGITGMIAPTAASAGTSVLGNAASSAGTSALFGGTSLGALGSAFGEGFMATLGGSSLSGGTAAGLLAGGAAPGTGIAGTLGAAAPYALAAGAVLAALGAFRTTKTVGGGLQGTLGEGDITGYDLRRKSGYLLGGPDYSIRQTGVAAQSATLQKAYVDMRTASVGMADALGLGSDAIKNFTTRLGSDLIHPDTGGLGLKLDGLKPDEVEAKIAAAMKSANDAIAAELLGVKTTIVTTTTKMVEEAVGPLGEWGQATAKVTKEVTESMTATNVTARKDLLPWMQRIVDKMGPTADALKKLYTYSDELLTAAGTGRDELVKIYAEGFKTGDIAGAGRAVADTLVASIEQTMIGGAAGQIFDIANRGIITPILDAMLNGQTLSQALADGAIDATITKIKEKATALATVMNDPRIKELMDGLKTSLGDALGGGAAVNYTPQYQPPPTKAVGQGQSDAEKAADAKKITDELLGTQSDLLIEKLRAQGHEEEAVALERERAIKGMDAYQVGLYDSNQQLRAQVDLINKTNAQRAEYESLGVELLRAQGRESEALAAQRRIDIKGMTQAEVELYDLNAARRAEIDSIERTKAAISDLWSTADSLASKFLSPSDAATYQRTRAAGGLVDAGVINQAQVSGLVSVVAGMTSEQIKTEGLRLASGYDVTTEAGAKAANAILQFAGTLYDLKKAAEDASIDAALSAVGRAVDAEKEAITKAADAKVKALQDQIDASQEAAKAAAELTGSLEGMVKNIQQAARDLRGQSLTESARYEQAAAFVQTATVLGRMGARPDENQLADALRVLTSDQKERYATEADFALAQAKQAASVEGLGAVLGKQLTDAQKQQKELEKSNRLAEDQIKSIQESASEQIKNLDAIYTSAKAQIDAIRGVDLSVVSVKKAVEGLQTAIAALASRPSAIAPKIVGESAAASRSSVAQPAIAPLVAPAAAVPFDADVRAAAEQLAAAKGTEAAIAAVKDYGYTLAQANSILGLPAGTAEAEADRLGIPKFATGGYHSGGWALVGEQGPELAYMPPAHIINAADTRKIMGDDGVAEKIQSLERTVASLLSVIAGNTQRTATVLSDVTDSGTAMRLGETIT